MPGSAVIGPALGISASRPCFVKGKFCNIAGGRLKSILGPGTLRKSVANMDGETGHLLEVFATIPSKEFRSILRFNEIHLTAVDDLDETDLLCAIDS